MTILVCGLGRCGTTLVMKMLYAAGVPVFADSLASFEHQAMRLPGDIDQVFPLFRGEAVKILDPFRWDFGAVPFPRDTMAIWVRRNYKEQAKSQQKFLKWCGVQSVSGQWWRDCQRVLPKETEESMAVLLGHNIPTHIVQFEDILKDPLREATRIAVAIGRPAGAAVMASVVIERSPQCAPDMAIEERAASAEVGVEW